MRRALTELLPEDHRSIEKRSCKRRDSNERPNYQNVSFSLSSAASFFDWWQSHCFSLYVLPGALRDRRVCSRSQPAFRPARARQVLYNDVHLAFSFVLIMTQCPASGASALIGYGGRCTAGIVSEKTRTTSPVIIATNVFFKTTREWLV